MTTANLEIHNERQQWLNDDAIWRDELGIWVEETNQAVDGLRKLEDSLGVHRKRLQDHLATIIAEEKTLRDQENVLAQIERGGSGNEPLGMAKTHKENLNKHVHQRQRHELLKKHHHMVMAYWIMLFKVLTEKI